MGTGYARKDTTNNIANGNVINASDLDAEFDGVEAAFDESTGHDHGGGADNGAPITKVGPAQDLVVSISAVTPKTDNTLDLGSSTFEFKDLWIDGTANIDSLVADTADINGGSIDGVTIGTNSVVTDLRVDNIQVNGNTISSTDTNGNVVIAPNGTGDVQLDADTVRVGDSNANATVTTNGTGDLILNTNAGTNSGSITIEDGVNGNIIIAPNGTGQVQITNASLDLTSIEVTNIKAKDGTAAATIADSTGKITVSTELAVDNLNLSGNAITSTDTNGNIDLTPNGTGEVNITKVDIDSGTIDGTTIGGSSAAAGTFTTVSATTGNITTVNATTVDTTNIEVTNIKAKDGTAAASIADSTGKITVSTELAVDNLNLAGNTLSSTDANGNIVIAPNGTGQVVVNAGAVGTPTIAPTGDTNTGIYFPAADTIAFAEGGVEAMRITSSAEVLIGTTSSGAKLRVRETDTTAASAYLGYFETSAGGAFGIQVSDKSLAAPTWNIQTGASEPIAFLQSSTERIRIDSSGILNVLMTGAETGTTNGFQFLSPGGTGGLTIYSSAAARDQIQLKDTVTTGPSSGNTSAFGVSSGALYIKTGGSERMRIDSSGSVGIGTTSPSSFNSSGLPLVVGSGSGNTGLTIYSGTAASGSIHFADGTTTTDSYRGIVAYSHTSNYMTFWTDATERMRIDSSGNVGIGATPTNRFHVADNSASAMIYGLQSGAGDIIALSSGASEKFRITNAGNVGIGTSSPSQKLTVSVSSGSVVGLVESTATNGEASWQISGKNSSGTARSALFKYDNSDLIRIGTASAIAMRFETSDTERARITSGGDVGIGTTSPITKLDVNGTSIFRNTLYEYQPAPTALTGSVTLTAAQILTRIITTTGGSATLTLPTGSSLDSGLPSSFPNDGAFDFTIINTDSGQDSLAGNTGVTIVGIGAVSASSSGTFRLRKTGTATYVVYRL